MRPEKPLPFSDEFESAEDYISSLLDFATGSDLFQILCGGVHILDFFTHEPGLFYTAIPAEWQDFLLGLEPMALLDLLMRDDLDTKKEEGGPPDSFLRYVRDIRRLSLSRTFKPRKPPRLPVLPRSVVLGMKTKKIHEVTNFAGYVDQLADEVARLSSSSSSSSRHSRAVTHYVDFGSGQNYLGRALASPPYDKHVVAVESRAVNMAGAKSLDMLSGIAEQERVVRNKKVFLAALEAVDPARRDDAEALRSAARTLGFAEEEVATIDLRPRSELEATYVAEEGKGFIQYVVGRLENADLTDVIAQLDTKMKKPPPSADADAETEDDLCMMAISIHSCGNLSHYGIRSLVLNPAVQAVAIVGCCYNLLTEKLGPPTYKLPFNRPSLQAVNGRVVRESERRDPQGFPMSERLSRYDGERGIRLNITARMMACQAPQNWTDKESDAFFTRHFYRAVLQKMFLDKGVITKVTYGEGQPGSGEEVTITSDGDDSPFNSSTNPVIIGSLRKQCYTSLQAYIRGAIAKLTTNAEFSQYSRVVREKLGAITDAEIDAYERTYRARRRELSAVWSLMAFSACVVESLIVADRWLFLKEHPGVVRDCWVEAVFDYRESPRNLVVVGIKR